MPELLAIKGLFQTVVVFIRKGKKTIRLFKRLV